MTYQALETELKRIIDKSETIEQIKKEYEPLKTDYINAEKVKEYGKTVKTVKMFIFYPDAYVDQKGNIKITQRKRPLLFTEWHNNHFKDSPELDNQTLEEYQTLIFQKIKANTEAGEKNKASNTLLKRRGQAIFKTIIDNGEGIFGGYQIKYILSTIAEQSQYKHAVKVHKEKFSRILFTAFAEGGYVDRQQLKKTLKSIK